MDSVVYYKQMTSDKPGAIAIFHLYGGEALLSSRVDVLLRAEGGGAPGRSLSCGELRYGWLYPAHGGEAVDEVMLAKPAAGMRVLMTHGGVVVTRAVAAAFRVGGCVELTSRAAERDDPLDDPVVSHCLTEAQAAAALRWRAGGAEPPPGLMRTHRVVLAGPPNAGKSSLLNQLCRYDRAFVHPEAGATRDVVDELVEIGGYAVWLGDLPGFSEDLTATDSLVGEAWRRAALRLGRSEMVWFVADSSLPWEGETAEAAAAVAAILAAQDLPPRVLVVANKADLPPGWDGEPWRRVFPRAEAVRVSSLPQGDATDVLAACVATLWGL
ncbi:MAG: 50S ribosome-binding GTPase [Planctomycetaceae bacterium]|nr:50S ribosome-binding GTPase [Planctomycetaceae bacterium]